MAAEDPLLHKRQRRQPPTKTTRRHRLWKRAASLIPQPLNELCATTSTLESLAATAALQERLAASAATLETLSAKAAIIEAFTTKANTLEALNAQPTIGCP